MLEVWADEACTVRPVVGQQYQELFLQINAEIHEQCPAPGYLKDMDGVNYETCRNNYIQGDDVGIRFSTEWTNILGIYQGPDTSLELSPQVIKLSSDEPYEVLEIHKLSSGPILAR